MREAEGENGKEILLLPFSKSNDYRGANIKIARTLHLQQLVRLPSLSHRPGNLPKGATNPPAAYKKPVRQQPEGLRMRYRPFGDSESSSPERSDKAPSFRSPPVVPTQQLAKERKDGKTNGDDSVHQSAVPKLDALVPETPNTSKKRKHIDINREEHENQESVTKSKKRKHDKTSNLKILLANTKEQSVQVDTYSNAHKIQSSEEPLRRPPIAREGSPKKTGKNEEIKEIPPTTDLAPTQTPKPENPQRNESKKFPKQTSEDTPKHPPETPREAPSMTEKSKPPRSNAEKRRRKEEHGRRKEARESKIRDQENQSEIIPGCERPPFPPLSAPQNRRKRER